MSAPANPARSPPISLTYHRHCIITGLVITGLPDVPGHDQAHPSVPTLRDGTKMHAAQHLSRSQPDVNATPQGSQHCTAGQQPTTPAPPARITTPHSRRRRRRRQVLHDRRASHHRPNRTPCTAAQPHSTRNKHGTLFENPRHRSALRTHTLAARTARGAHSMRDAQHVGRTACRAHSMQGAQHAGAHHQFPAEVL